MTKNTKKYTDMTAEELSLEYSKVKKNMKNTKTWDFPWICLEESLIQISLI